jgi:hypothetical protein
MPPGEAITSVRSGALERWRKQVLALQKISPATAPAKGPIHDPGQPLILAWFLLDIVELKTVKNG